MFRIPTQTADDSVMLQNTEKRHTLKFAILPVNNTIIRIKDTVILDTLHNDFRKMNSICWQRLETISVKETKNPVISQTRKRNALKPDNIQLTHNTKDKWRCHYRRLWYPVQLTSMLSQLSHNHYSHTVCTFKQMDWYFNFSTWFIKINSIIWTKK